MQQENEKLTDDEILELESNYISINESEYITLLLQMIHKNIEAEDYLYKEANEDFEVLYNKAKMMNPAALPYSELTTIVFGNENEDGLLGMITFLKSKYKEIFLELKEEGMLCKKDKVAVSTIAKTVEHMNLALTQKENLLNEQITIINDLKGDLKEITNKLDTSKTVIDDHQKELKENSSKLEKYSSKLEKYSSKYEKMTMDYLSMMGIFSTIIFAVFGGLSQLGSLGGNLHLIPIHKMLMYVSVTSLTLLLLVFLCFNAISSMTKYNLKSCRHNEKCTCGIKEKHPTVWFGVVFFVELFFFSIVLRTLNYYKMTEKFGDYFSGLIGVIISLLFLACNVIFYINLNKKQN